MVGKYLSIELDVIIPTIINKNDNRMILMPLKLFLNIIILSGIKSMIDTQSITPAAKAKLALIIFSWFLNFIKMGNTPISVDNPARKVNKKAILIVPMISPINYMNYYSNN